jgi:hypothetical protein
MGAAEEDLLAARRSPGSAASRRNSSVVSARAELVSTDQLQTSSARVPA